MKVLFLISSLGIGGEQRVVTNLTSRLNEKGIQSDICTFNIDKNRFKLNHSIRIFHVKNSIFFKNLNRLFHIRSILYRHKYDVIVGFGFIPSILVSIACIGSRTSSIVAERNDPKIYPLLWKLIRSVVYTLSSGAVFQTNDASNYFSKKYFRKRVIIKNPVTIKDISMNDNIKEKVIVNISRLVKPKNQEILIRAFSELYSVIPDYSLDRKSVV